MGPRGAQLSQVAFLHLIGTIEIGVQRRLTQSVTEETGANGWSSPKQKTCAFPPPSPPAQLCSPQSSPPLKASPPCKPVPQGHLAAPSWLLILPAHSVVACAWEEPGGAPAGTLTPCRHLTVPTALGLWEPRHPSGGSAWPTRPRPTLANCATPLS